jgi:amidase
VPRSGVTDGITEEVAVAFETALQVMRDAGATVVDPAEFDPAIIADINSGFDEIMVLIFEFKDDLNAYLATRTGVPVRTMADVIAFNNAHADTELKWFGQAVARARRSAQLLRSFHYRPSHIPRIRI